MPIVISYTWVDGATGDWGTASNWSGGVVPDGTTNATVGGSGTETVTVSTNQSVNLLTLNDANATLAVTNGATLSAYGGVAAAAVREIDIKQGSLLIGGGSQTLDNATIDLGGVIQYAGGGTQSNTGTLTTDTASQTSAVLTLGPNLTVNASSGAIQSG